MTKIYPRAIRSTLAAIFARAADLTKKDGGRFFFSANETQAVSRRVFLEDNDGKMQELERVGFTSNAIGNAVSVAAGGTINAVAFVPIKLTQGTTIVFPSSPNVGDEIVIYPTEDLEAVNAFADYNGKKIMGETQTEPDPINVKFGLTFVYLSENFGWGCK